jgi:hypothetical protein
LNIQLKKPLTNHNKEQTELVVLVALGLKPMFEGIVFIVFFVALSVCAIYGAFIEKED